MTVAYSDIKADLHQKNDLLYHRETLFTGKISVSKDDVLDEKQYLNGLRHGIQKTYYQTGQLKEATIFTNGQENGRRIEYYCCGAKKMNANYSYGVLDGTLEEWDEEGVLIARKSYFKGKLIAIKSN